MSVAQISLQQTDSMDVGRHTLLENLLLLPRHEENREIGVAKNHCK